MRLISSLSARLPGTTAVDPNSVVPKAPSLVSSRRPALRLRGSGPWHLKHLFRQDGADLEIEVDRFAGGLAGGCWRSGERGRREMEEIYKAKDAHRAEIDQESNVSSSSSGPHLTPSVGPKPCDESIDVKTGESLENFIGAGLSERGGGVRGRETDRVHPSSLGGLNSDNRILEHNGAGGLGLRLGGRYEEDLGVRLAARDVLE